LVIETTIKHAENTMRIKNSKGFTLIEMLVVLSIIALLVSLVGPALFKHLSPAKQSVARAQMDIFMSSLDAFYMDAGRFPTNAEGLEALRTKPAAVNKWQGPYLKKDLPKDPWGNPYIYKNPGRNGGFEIVSLGADGAEGGSDENSDINSWEAAK
jgi:general secretion pathway protein G